MGRKNRRSRGPAAAALVLLLLAPIGGCATGSSAGDGSTSAAVEVQNDLIPPASLTIYLVPESGVRHILGDVGPSQTRVLNIRDPLPGQHRFMARTTSGSEIVSNPFAVSASDTLRWDLSSNIVTTISGDDPE